VVPTNIHGRRVARVPIRRNELKMGAPGASPLGTWDSTDIVSPVFLLLGICWVSFYGRVAHPEFLKSYSAHKFGCPILSAVSSRKGWEPRIPTNGPGIGFLGCGEVGPLSAERPDSGHHEPQPAKPTASPIPKYSAFQATYFLFPPTFYAFRISSSCRPKSLAKSANNLQLIKW
jgi:hypothetical protein